MTASPPAENDARAFPLLNDEEWRYIEDYGTARSFAPGEALVEAGCRDYSFFAIRSGDTAITERSSGTARLVGHHPPGSFTGDIDMLTGRPAVVTITAETDCETVEITASRIRQMMRDLPGLSDKLLDTFQIRRERIRESGFLGIRVYGPADCRHTLRLREFFYKNSVPHTFFDIAEEENIQALEQLGATTAETPVMFCGEQVVKQPSLGKVAECLGICREIKEVVYDVLIVGCGPGGLAAGVYAGSEGLRALVIDSVGPGGQAGQSSKIENYMGFPAGLSGADLANRGYLQALKFGVEFTSPVSVVSLTTDEEGLHHAELCTGQVVTTKTVLIATGASYRKLPIEHCERFEGAGVFYSATSVESRLCQDSTAVVVGGGNSAGQAAMFLSGQAREVKMILRGGDLRKSMSDYLARRIEQTPNIEVLFHTEVESLVGDDSLREICLREKGTDQSRISACRGLFIFVGAKPHTDWLPDSIRLDDKGFVLVGPALETSDLPDERPPCELETSLPGVFAAGDVRSGTTKRCAFAVGDGALAVTCVHQYLNRLR